MKAVNILLVDDEVLLREGLRSLLSEEDFVNKIYEAGSANEFETVLKEKQVDLILLDIRIPGTSGVELLNLAKEKSERLKVIAVTGLEGVELMINLLKAGVHGIVFKLDGYSEILKAIKTVLSADNYFPEKILRIIQTNAHRWDNVPPVLLSRVESDLITALASGMTTKEIAEHLKTTIGTAETYRVRLSKKLGVSNTAGLLAYAFRNGIL